MNKKTEAEKLQYTRDVASKIFDYLTQTMKEPFDGSNKSNFRFKYAAECKRLKLTSYSYQISDFLGDNNYLDFRNGKIYLKKGFTVDDIIKAIRDYNNRPNQGQKKVRTKRNIKRENFRGQEPTVQKHLTPLFEAFKKISIEQKLETMSFSDVPQVVQWLRKQGLEVKATVLQEF